MVFSCCCFIFLGEVDVLVGTDVVARGIDVKNVTLVINYDMPKTVGGELFFIAFIFYRVYTSCRKNRKNGRKRNCM